MLASLYDPAQLAAFLAAAVLVTVAPGPDNLMILSLGMARGRRHGICFGLGCAGGCLSHTALAAAGISAVIAASPWAFLALKIAGGLYLAWIGWNLLRHPDLTKAQTEEHKSDSGWTLFRRGLVANIINPKVILFFLAFLPQFIVAGHGHVALQTLGLGLLFALQAGILFGLLGASAGQLGQMLTRRPAVARWLNRAAGITFIGIGARLVTGR